VSKLLSDRIRELHLRPNAPYPSEMLKEKEAAKDAHDMIRKWRESQRVHIVTRNYDEERDGD
jgi:hypothetical protein